MLECRTYLVFPTSIFELISPLEIRLLIFSESLLAVMDFRFSAVELLLELADE